MPHAGGSLSAAPCSLARRGRACGLRVGAQWRRGVCAAGAGEHRVLPERLAASVLLGHSAPAFHLHPGPDPRGSHDVPNGRGQLR